MRLPFSCPSVCNMHDIIQACASAVKIHDIMIGSKKKQALFILPSADLCKLVVMNTSQKIIGFIPADSQQCKAP